MNKTKIDWCDSTWNPVTGCYHGCEYCYARNIAHRFSGGGENWTDDEIIVLNEKIYGEESERAMPYPYGFKPTFHRYKLDEYQKKKRSRNIFVCFLTKNPKRYIDLCQKGLLPKEDNFWFGSSATKSTDHYSWFTDQKFHWFLSMEPLLEEFGEINPGAAKPEWVIIGAETGNRKDKVIPRRAWIENIVDQCRQYGIPVFMKDSLTYIWGTELIREFPKQLLHG